jgi:hypothetical protein
MEARPSLSPATLMNGRRTARSVIHYRSLITSLASQMSDHYKIHLADIISLWMATFWTTDELIMKRHMENII